MAIPNFFILVPNTISVNNVSEIEIPETLAKKIEKMIEGTSFDSISDYVTYVLEELLEEEEEEEIFSEEEEEKIRERLRALGYLD